MATYAAGGDINPCRFVVQSASADNTVTESGANGVVIGISQEHARDAPIPSASALAAASGDSVWIHTPSDASSRRCLLQLGDTVVRGGYLKSDADGKGVPIATDSQTTQNVGARAIQSGSADDFVLVEVMEQQRLGAAGLIMEQQYLLADLSANGDLAETIIWSPTQAVTILDVLVTPDGTAAGVDDSNTSVWLLEHDTTTIVTKTYDSSNAFPADGVQTSLGAIASGSVGAAEDVFMTITNGTTADLPACVVTIRYQIV